MQDVAGEVFKALDGSSKELLEMGRAIGRLYTDHGLPVDMAFDRLVLTRKEKIVVLVGVHEWLIEHRRQSQATPKALERLEKSNRAVMQHFLKTGETGLD